ncbi:hypothetical protein SERLA73DRAFT_126649 [Serpula lacrymans var. lacrymans S7.3]|uniref:Uncharacterized protein n=1 Tax=Serpula lacrymans var. lacrymans (strain S7.3) TaxID=936435 RepID=F8QE54_SERL3|nr:hypothetical protein SERLA73DRAFT_126649 [Serpula lacrymans var. lacrymans S7.3]
MTLNIPFLFAHVLVQHLFGMEENFETSVICHLRASLLILPIHTKAKCQSAKELNIRVIGTKGGFTPNGLTFVQTLFTRYQLIIY